jgi:DNA-binding NarL/FixJ family response regulator
MLIRLVLARVSLGVRTALEAVLQRQPDVHVVARAQSGEETLHAVRQHRPDVVILPLRLPDKDGLDVLRAMRQDKLPMRVVLLMESLNEATDDELLEALRLGIGGVVLPGMPPQQLVGCLRKVAAGDLWLESGTVGRAVETLLRREVAARARAKGLRPEELADPEQELA